MPTKNLVLPALILNDYAHAHYASWIKEGIKLLETRGKAFSHRGDLVICCGKTNSVTPNAGKALCVVDLWKVREMRPEDEKAACIECAPKRKVHLLRNWRYFSEDFEYGNRKVSGTWQGIFMLSIPDGLEIVPQPQIIPYNEPETP